MGTLYGQLVAANMRAARARSRLSMTLVAQRMKALGFGSWSHGKVSECERGERGIRADELLALSAALECTMVELLGANPSDGEITFPSGDAVGAVSVRNSAYGMQDNAVTWRGNLPSITRPGNAYSAQAWDRTLLGA